MEKGSERFDAIEQCLEERATVLQLSELSAKLDALVSHVEDLEDENTVLKKQVCRCKQGSQDHPIKVEDGSESGLSYATPEEASIRLPVPISVLPAVSGQRCKPSTQATSLTTPPPQTGIAWEGVHARLQQVHRTLAQLEVAATILTEVSGLLQSRAGIAKELALREASGEREASRNSREDSPPVTMSHEQLAMVGEPTNKQVTMWVADEVVWEAQREEWIKEGSGGEDTDYDADSGKSR